MVPVRPIRPRARPVRPTSPLGRLGYLCLFLTPPVWLGCMWGLGQALWCYHGRFWWKARPGAPWVSIGTGMLLGLWYLMVASVVGVLGFWVYLGVRGIFTPASPGVKSVAVDTAQEPAIPKPPRVYLSCPEGQTFVGLDKDGKGHCRPEAVPDATLTGSGLNASSAIVMPEPVSMASRRSVWPTATLMTVTNEPLLGTMQNHLATTVQGSGAVMAMVSSDQGTPLYICVANCSTRGASVLAMAGEAACVMDESREHVYGWAIVGSALRGRCHAQPLPPAEGMGVGYMLDDTTVAGQAARVLLRAERRSAAE